NLLPADALGLNADAVVVWLDPQAPEATARVTSLRTQRGSVVPAVLVVGETRTTAALTAATAAGAGAYVASGDPAYLAAAVGLVLESATRFAQLSPLTGLPGNNTLQNEITRRLPQRGELAILAFDVDEFKAYNDCYGHQQGDSLLRHLRAVIVQALSERAGPGWFAAHVGGDDFFALVHPSEAQAVAERVIELFEAGIDQFYTPEDRARGRSTVRTRTGAVRDVPLATVTVAAVTNEADDVTHPGQMAAVLAELKAYGKPLPGSNYVPNRRRIHDSATALASRLAADYQAPYTHSDSRTAPEGTDG
ncbi:MAG: GGDEF domain-containing protein, partial [Armatimonadota bacterium]